MDINPFFGVPVKVNLNSEIGRFGLIVRVGGMSRTKTIADATHGQEKCVSHEQRHTPAKLGERKLSYFTESVFKVVL